ncbi:cupin domain-containing protein [Marinomonas balearica]|uniref:Putative cupin superfamily sugar epimerase n=1 Tax=Marinomonas balearica TaxID=491947 RepID=A0A4R6MDM3_9GAMM|nr:cupin domain-containing protein [Marinomonas balearica]TDO99827.1 putative cupin superfamily sugar epimerase [Marinomonas balearica]
MTDPTEACVFHIVLENQASKILQSTTYTAPSLSTDGFVHFCSFHQVGSVVKEFYRDQKNLKLLVIDVSLLRSELRYEIPDGNKLSYSSTEDLYPHLYGSLNVDAIIDVMELNRFNQKPVHPDTASMLRHYRFERLPVEGTLFKSTWRASQQTADDKPSGTAMIGLYANEPESVSCFHKLDYDEVWHVYGGDPFTLYLLYPDGQTEEIIMGQNVAQGQYVQYVVPAGVWQAGCLNQGGRYALFGCTMAPGFTGSCFEAGQAANLIELYPSKAEIIQKLSVNGDEKYMPDDFAN